MPTPAARIAAALADHVEIAVQLAPVDALDDQDAAMVEQAVEYVTRRSGERRAGSADYQGIGM
jgi:hypothetical protein